MVLTNDQLQVYNIKSNKWTTSELPNFVGSVSSTIMKTNKKGDLLMYCGGIEYDTVPHCHAYSFETKKWSELARMNRGVNHAAFASDGRRYFYVFGGRNGGNVVSPGFRTAQRYDVVTDTWSALPRLPLGRGGMGPAVYVSTQQKVYVFGGETTDKSAPGVTKHLVFRRVDVFDVRTSTWSRGPELPRGLHGISPVLHENVIYIPGGGIKKGNSQSRQLIKLDLACI